jgi:hypothetical protein
LFIVVFCFSVTIKSTYSPLLHPQECSISSNQSIPRQTSRNMSASPPPSTDVKPEQGLSEPTLIEQPDQHPTPAPPRRTSYSLYYHNTDEPEVYPEFNWPEHSSAQLSNMGDPALSENDAAENKADNSPLALALEPYQGTASPSPPSSSVGLNHAPFCTTR